MRVVAKRKSGLGGIYGFVAFLGAALLLLEIILAFFKLFLFGIFIIMGLIISGMSLGVLIDYYKTPKTIIMANDKNDLVLNSGEIIFLESIADVSYERAYSRVIQYEYGTVTITTPAKKYEFRYVDGCEKVTKEITRLMYERKIEKIMAQNG